MLDGRGRVIAWNSQSEKLSGYNASEMIGKNFSILFTNAGNRLGEPERMLRAAEKDDRFVDEGVRVRKGGKPIWVRSFLTFINDGVRGKKMFVLTMQDITAAKARESQREEYIGMASHELRNPIATLSLYTELLGSALQLQHDKKNLETLRDMQGETIRLARLVEDMLVVGKIEGGTLLLHREVFSINQLVRQIVKNVRLISPTHKIVVRGSREYRTRADKSRITQVFINLLTNAVTYSPSGGKIIVEIKRAKNKCVVSVRDFGHGIAQADQAKVFDRFFRTTHAARSDSSGSGLGLFISKEIVKKHRERIWLKSTPGKGTTFFFTLTIVR